MCINFLASFTIVEIENTLEELNLRRVTICMVWFAIIPRAKGVSCRWG